MRADRVGQQDVLSDDDAVHYVPGKQTTVGEMTKEQVDQLKAQLH